MHTAKPMSRNTGPRSLERDARSLRDTKIAKTNPAARPFLSGLLRPARGKEFTSHTKNAKTNRPLWRNGRPPSAYSRAGLSDDARKMSKRTPTSSPTPRNRGLAGHPSPCSDALSGRGEPEGVLLTHQICQNEPAHPYPLLLPQDWGPGGLLSTKHRWRSATAHGIIPYHSIEGEP